MSRKQTDGILMGISIFSFLMLAISFLLMPLGGKNDADRMSICSFVAGIMFWTSLAIAILTQCVLGKRQKKWCKIHKIKKIRSSNKVGLLLFFKNTYASVADILFVVCFIGFIISMLITKGTGYICYVFIALFVFSFSMHCVLNGKIYYYVINQNKLLRDVEKERANLSK